MMRFEGYLGGRSLHVLTLLDAAANKFRSYVVSARNSNSSRLKVNQNRMLAAEAAKVEG